MEERVQKRYESAKHALDYSRKYPSMWGDGKGRDGDWNREWKHYHSAHVISPSPLRPALVCQSAVLEYSLNIRCLYPSLRFQRRLSLNETEGTARQRSERRTDVALGSDISAQFNSPEDRRGAVVIVGGGRST